MDFTTFKKIVKFLLDTRRVSFFKGPIGDILAVMHPLKAYFAYGLINPVPGLADIIPQADHI